MHTSRFGYFTPFQDGMQLSNYSFDSRVVLNERENAKVLLARSEPLVAVVFEEFATSWHIVYDRRPASVIWRKGARAGVFTAVQTNIIVFWISFVAIDEGLITIIPNVGTTVALVDPARILECCVIRSSLECTAIETAVKKFDSTTDARLSQLIDEQDETVTNGDMVRNIAIDTEFHRVIVALSGFKSIESILSANMSEIMRVRHLSIKLPGRLRQPILEHQAILAALRTGNPEKCSAAMKDHLSKSYLSVVQVIEAMPR